MKITAAQRRTLDAIREHWKARGYAPTYRDIAEALGVTTNAAVRSVRILERKGALRHAPGVARSIIVTRRGREAA